MTLIEAAKQAREALQRSDYLGWQLNIPIIKALDQAIAEAEQQEPVAIVTGYYGGHLTVTPFNLSSTLPTGMALYTSPPKREWQGLTDDEVKALYYNEPGDYYDMARAIEAKLKEKNT